MKELGVYKQLVYLPYLVSYKKTVEAAIRLDLFSHLTRWKTPEELAGDMKWDAVNTKNFLEALYSLGFLFRDGEKFRDSEDAEKYLVKGSPEYMGTILLFFGSNQGMDPGDVAKQVVEGGKLPEQMEQMQGAVDFAAYGDMMREAQSGIRQKEIVDLVRSLPENDSLNNILDLGCGAGMIGIAIQADKKDRTMTFFDAPSMTGLIEGSVAKAGIQARVVGGDFLKDDIGEGYDMILASSIMFFAMADLPGFMKKMYDALKPGGIALCINEGIAPDASEPWEMILGYLPMKLQGMPVGVPKGLVRQVAEAAGFKVENRTLLLSTGTHDINILRK